MPPSLQGRNARLPETLQELQSMLKKRGRAQFAAGMIEGIAAMLHPTDVVIDCGANVGSVSGVLLGSGAKVHAFEPDPHGSAILAEKFGHLPNFTLHRVAVGKKAGTATFYRNESKDTPTKSCAGNSLFPKPRFAQTKAQMTQVDVDVIDFPAFVADLLGKGISVPFVKLDVEGAELGIVRRMLDMNLFDQIRLTLAETHEQQLPDWADDFASLRRDVAQRYPKTRVNLDWI